MNLLSLKSIHSPKSSCLRTITACSPRQDLKGRTVAVVGLGISGKAAARLALARGASVVGIDQNENLLKQDSSFVTLKDNGLDTILGHFDWKLLNDADVVVVSPGVSLENYGLMYLLQSGKQVMSELDFAAEVLPKSVKILAVTGTNGKSTVVTFAGQMLSHFGINTFVGGNLGTPLSEMAFEHLRSPSQESELKVAVVEVSSCQMEIPCVYFCPSVSVVLNLTPDHLERHKTMLSYAESKCRLFSHMANTKLGLLSFGNQYLDDAVRKYWNKFNLAWIGAFPGVKIDTDAKIATFKVPDIGVASQLQLGGMRAIGNHNYYNAAVAALSVAGLDVGVHVEAINSTIEKLRPPPHRMQVVHKDIHGVTWVDDSKATNIALHIQGLRGHRCVITFGSSGAMIHQTLSDNGLSIPCIQATNLKDAVQHARKMAKHGDAIVLSPACASFDEFRNFEHRGMFFQELAFSA
ncbi:hypothetical protein F3Y22_tig00110949pilonHSYRG00047 [Hibiscus syriacus]|uniref:Mur ligase central domain-containing protein n=1 Tax=Hibiscus syriacus TaxID=106335 RepID=A0A6A2ZBX0_HIBSY|nr:hypothetical protein F3Y22_tig00110949pilonHSYRG00047 [Hibiscus syriacus]